MHDVVDVHDLRQAGQRMEIAGEAPQCWIVADPADVALKVAVIDRVEADERREQPDVRLGQYHANEVSRSGKRLRQSVERLEQRCHRLLIGLLRGRNAGAVLRASASGETSFSGASSHQ